MLYYLTDSLLVDEKHPKFNIIQQSLKRLGISAVESNHLILGDYDILYQASCWFKHDNELSPLFSKLVQNYSLNVIPPFVKYYLELVLDDPVTRKDDNGRQVAQICPEDVSTLESVAPVGLVVEDLCDADFYNHILDWYKIRCGITANFRYNSIHGGGGRIVEVIKSELRKKHVSLTILDTDMRYPGCDIEKNDTYKKCVKLGRKAPYYKFLPLKVHEIENLIPSNYIDILDKWENEVGKVKKNHYDCLKKKAEIMLPYFDIKKGIRKNSIMADPAYYEFARQCYELNPNLYSKESNFDLYVNSKEEKDVIYEGLIENIMKAVLEKIKINDFPSPVLYEFQTKNWEQIGQSMTDWCISRNNESLY